jgi:hypothetical protein
MSYKNWTELDAHLNALSVSFEWPLTKSYRVCYCVVFLAQTTAQRGGGCQPRGDNVTRICDISYEIHIRMTYEPKYDKITYRAVTQRYAQSLTFVNAEHVTVRHQLAP